MKRLHFRLTLEPGIEGIVRLVQLHHYATDLVDGKRALIGPALQEQIKLNFPARNTEDVLDALLGEGPPGWNIEGAEGGKTSVVISTEGAGVAVSAIIRILEQVAPEALLRPIGYDPLPGNTLAPPSKSLH